MRSEEFMKRAQTRMLYMHSVEVGDVADAAATPGLRSTLTKCVPIREIGGLAARTPENFSNIGKIS